MARFSSAALTVSTLLADSASQGAAALIGAPARGPRDLEALERLGDRIAELSAHLDAATHRLLVMIREFDRQEGWCNGFTSCAHWLSWRTSLAPGAARERVRVARALAQLPLLSDAMRRGELSYSKARALTRVATPENEADLVDVARHATASHVERIVSAWRTVDRNAERAAEAERHQLRELWLTPKSDGSYVIRGRLDPEVGAALLRALEAADDQMYPDRSARRAVPGQQRRADALGLVAEGALGGGIGDGSRADRFQVVLHVQEKDLREVAAAEEQPAAARAGDPTEPTATGDPAAAARAGDPTAATTTGDPAGATHTGVPADDTAARSAEAPADRGAAPESDLAPHVAHGPRVSAETCRRLACDAGRVVITHDPSGRVLDVGRKTRTVPSAIRRALENRDGGCRFPGCGNRFCDAHHVVHWADGGATRLDNLLSVCRVHHRLLHEGGYRVESTGDGGLRFIDPQGRTLQQVPDRPPIPADVVAAVMRDNGTAGSEIGPWTPTPLWYGERLDLHYAIAIMWRPKSEPAGTGAGRLAVAGAPSGPE